jgi:hypothetical protein
VTFKRHTLTLALLNFALEYAIRMSQGNEVGLKLHRVHQRLVWADIVNPLRGNIKAIKRRTQALVDIINGVGLDAHKEECKCMPLECGAMS